MVPSCLCVSVILSLRPCGGAAGAPRTTGSFAQDEILTAVRRLTVILSLRRIRDPGARRDEVRILRLRSQARFAQDDTALRDRVRNFRNPLLTLWNPAAWPQ